MSQRNIEFGDDKVGRVEVDFLTGPEITGRFFAPSLEIARDKAEFGSSRVRRWFGT